jgi:hypothetical protein
VERSLPGLGGSLIVPFFLTLNTVFYGHTTTPPPERFFQAVLKTGRFQSFFNDLYSRGGTNAPGGAGWNTWLRKAQP